MVKKSGKSKNVLKSEGRSSLYTIPKAYKGNKKFESKSVKTFLQKNLKGTTPAYRKKVIMYLNTHLKISNDIKGAIQNTRIDVEKKWDNRLKFVRKDKRTGKKIWLDVKTGKNIRGKAVRKIVWESTRTKVIEILAEEKGISFNEAKVIYKQKMERKYAELKKQKQFKNKLKEWKKQGLSKTEIAERGEKLLEGRAELRTIRNITDSYYYG